ncbi:unnamed protein product [Calypogeia fissa]
MSFFGLIAEWIGHWVGANGSYGGCNFVSVEHQTISALLAISLFFLWVWFAVTSPASGLGTHKWRPESAGKLERFFLSNEGVGRMGDKNVKCARSSAQIGLVTFARAHRNQ